MTKKPDSCCEKANRLSSEKRYAEALNWFDTCLKKSPNYVDAHYGEGIALHRLK
jgi:hypothetical protein